jgi:trimethyllysine dioxygenase
MTDFLGAHTDNTYFTDPSRLQLFHLLSHLNGEGGATLLVDGFKAAKIMAEENPEGYRIFGATPQPFHSSGNEHVCIQPNKLARVFEHDEKTGLLYRIRWNNYDRAAKADWTFESQQLWYEAARHWNEIITHPTMEIWMQLQPGTALSTLTSTRSM